MNKTKRGRKIADIASHIEEIDGALFFYIPLTSTIYPEKRRKWIEEMERDDNSFVITVSGVPEKID